MVHGRCQMGANDATTYIGPVSSNTRPTLLPIKMLFYCVCNVYFFFIRQTEKKFCNLI